MKILYIDVETTGLDWNLHGIVQLAFIIEVDGQVVEQHQFKMLPHIQDTIDRKAMEVNHLFKSVRTSTTGMASRYDWTWLDEQRPAVEVWNEVKLIWRKYIDQFNSQDKFVVAGYNCQAFDIPFLRKWIEKCEPETKFSVAGSFLGHTCLDPLPIFQFWKASGHFDDDQLRNLKLATVCALLEVDHEDEHDALSDIKATRILIKRVQVSQCDLDWINLYSRLEIEGKKKLDKKEPAKV